jgi:hypothetical protein
MGRPTKEKGDPIICDFCSDPNPVWCFPARDFILDDNSPLVQKSVGNWAACDECHALILAVDREGLRERSVANYLRLVDPECDDEAGLRRTLGRLHNLFFEFRCGEPRREDHALCY